jgi:hypothetical protein
MNFGCSQTLFYPPLGIIIAEGLFIRLPMDKDFSMLELDELRKLHNTEVEALNTTLLNGAAWEEVQEQRHRVMLIEMEIDKRQYAQVVEGSAAPTELLAESLRHSLLTRFI